MSKINWPLFWGLIGMGVCVSLLYVLPVKPAHSRDLGQWDRSSEESKWFATLMQPDNPTISCCGEGDAYWCDTIHVNEGKTFCTITDDRDDAPLGRRHVDVGTEIEIPDYKLTWKDGNPTGHAIVFLSPSGFYVYCFVQNGGV